MKRKDAASLTGLGIAAFVYHIVDELLDPATKKIVPTTQSERLAWLGQCGLPVYHGKYLVSEDSNAVLQWCEDTGEQRQDLGYDIDGMVIKLDDTRYYGELGSTSHHPRWGIAYKFPPAEQTTILRAVTVQVGKSGKLTPVAELDPVFLAGTTVSRATLHNFSEVSNKDIHLGDTVRVIKAGDIIPQVVAAIPDKRVKDATPIIAPETCPACGTPVEHEEVFHFCPNPSCPAQVHERLAHFVSRNAMDVDGCGTALIEQMINAFGITRPGQLFTISKEQLLTLERMGEKKADNYLRGIATAKTAAWPKS